MPSVLSKAEMDRLERPPIPIPTYNPRPGQRFTQPFSVSVPIRKYRPHELLKRELSQPRTIWFSEQLKSICWDLGRAVPYAFRTNDGTPRSLDAGCLGHLLNRDRPEFRANLDADGFIEFVELIEPLREHDRLPLVSDTSSHRPTTEIGIGDEPTPDPHPAAEIVHVREFPVDIDPEQPVDERRREESRRVIRESGKEFRQDQITIWKGRCIVTGTSIRRVLDGAHIFRYLGEYTNHPSNGLLLRTDIHRLFDWHMLSISLEIDHVVVHVSSKLRQSEYWNFNAKRVAVPRGHSLARRYVEHHYREFVRRGNTERIQGVGPFQ